MQGHWLIFGGNPLPIDAGKILYDFDFATMSWSKAVMTGTPLQQRSNFAATCHQGALVVMGGNTAPYPHMVIYVQVYMYTYSPCFKVIGRAFLLHIAFSITYSAMS